MHYVVVMLTWPTCEMMMFSPSCSPFMNQSWYVPAYSVLIMPAPSLQRLSLMYCPVKPSFDMLYCANIFAVKNPSE